MSTIFPGSASVGQVYNNYTFDGTAWNINGIDLTENYLEESSASATYLTKVSASSTYTTQTSASTTYLPLSAASANQIIYKNSSNVATGSSGLNYDGVSLKVNGNLESVYSNGDEGGEIFLKKAATNTTLSDGVTLDIHQNRLRIFETTGNNRGAYIDMASLPNGVNTNLVPGLSPVIPSSVTVGSGTGTVSAGGTVTFSGASSLSMDGVFSSNYDAYQIIFSGVHNSTAVWVRSRLRKNSSDNTSGAYFYITQESNSSTGPVRQPYTGQANLMAGIIGNFMHGTIDMIISNPAKSDKIASWITRSQGYGSSTQYLTNNGGFFDSPGTGVYSWTGITFYPDSGTFSGTVRIYGYNNN